MHDLRCAIRDPSCGGAADLDFVGRAFKQDITGRFTAFPSGFQPLKVRSFTHPQTIRQHHVSVRRLRLSHGSRCDTTTRRHEAKTPPPEGLRQESRA